MGVGRCLLFLLLPLLVGCRAERVAFQFQPVPVQSSFYPEATSQPQRGDISAVKTAAETTKPRRGDTRMLPRPSAAPLGLGKRERRPLLPICRPAGAFAADPKNTFPSFRSTRRIATIVESALAKTNHQTSIRTAPHATDKGLGWLYLIVIVLGLLVLSGIGWGIAALFGIGFWQALSYFGVFILLLTSIGIIGELFFGW